MSLRIILFVSTVLSFNLFSQVTQENLDARQKFREFESKRLVKTVLANSTQSVKGDGSVDALYYEINLELNFTSQTISSGEVTGRFRSLANSLTQVILDFENNMNVTSVGGNGISYTHNGNHLAITLDQAYNIDDIFEVTVFYNGSPSSSGFGSWSMTSSRASTLSEPYGAKGWWPCKDTPNDKPDSVDIYITVPSNFDAVSNGKLMSVTPGPSSTQIWHWKETYPIATYLVSLAIANDYAHFSDIYVSATGDTLPLEHWVYQNHLSTAQATFAEVPDFIEALEYYFGPYPFYGEKYGMAEFDWGGGMEHQTITSIGGVSSGYRDIFVHELGHMWFGDQVTCKDFHHIWLNEGFASYSEPLFHEYTYGTAAYHNYMASQDHHPWSGTIYIQDTTNVWSIFSNIVYDKGSWVLHMLRHVVGDTVFFNILKTYASHPDFSYGTATTEDFQAICEGSSDKNLSYFFNQWIYNSGHPDYAYSWNVSPEGNNWRTRLVIKQLQTNQTFKMPIDITFQANGWDSTFVVINDTSYQRYDIITTTQPTTVLFDKDNWILCDVQQFVDGIEPYDNNPEYFLLEQNYPNPFNPETTIEFYTPDGTSAEIIIYDVTGREIKKYTISKTEVGTNKVIWSGEDKIGKPVSSGIYFYELVLPEKNIQRTRKMIKLN